MEEQSAPETINTGAIAAESVASAPISEVPAGTGESVVSTTAPSDSVVSSEKEIEFDWEGWDGKVEGVPDPWRKAVEGASGYYSKKFGDYDKIKGDLDTRGKEYESLKTEFDRVNRLYEAALANFGEDPRVQEIAQELDTLKSVKETLENEYKEFQQQVYQWREQEVKNWGEQLAKQYPKYFSEEESGNKLLSMLDEGWDAEIAIKILELGDSAVAAAKSFKAKGASDSLAFEFAELAASNAKVSPPKRDAAKVMAGADPAQAPVRASRTLNDVKDHQERVRLVAQRALQKHGG